MLKDCNGKKIPKIAETAILQIFAEKEQKPFHSMRKKRKIRMRNSENYRMFCLHDLDIAGKLLDTLSTPITRS
jgi:hypothetical protein